MVRSHIGNVVCSNALCVRVASSAPERDEQKLVSFFFFMILKKRLFTVIKDRTAVFAFYLHTIFDSLI